MNNISATNTIEQAENIITDIFENGTHDKDTGEGLYRVMNLIADVRSTIISIPELDEAYTISKGVNAIINELIQGLGPDDDKLGCVLYSLSNLTKQVIEGQEKAINTLISL